MANIITFEPDFLSVPPLSELAPEIEHYWGAILDRSFSEGAAANGATPEVATTTNGLEVPDVAAVENGDIDEGLPERTSSMP